jgi:hypothetical protein
MRCPAQRRCRPAHLRFIDITESELPPVNIRTWTITGAVAGGASLLMLGAITGAAFLGDAPRSVDLRIAALAVATVLLGTTAIASLATARIVTAVARQNGAYKQGIGDTVDRLAEALPGSKVRRIG